MQIKVPYSNPNSKNLLTKELMHGVFHQALINDLNRGVSSFLSRYRDNIFDVDRFNHKSAMEQTMLDADIPTVEKIRENSYLPNYIEVDNRVPTIISKTKPIKNPTYLWEKELIFTKDNKIGVFIPIGYPPIVGYSYKDDKEDEHIYRVTSSSTLAKYENGVMIENYKQQIKIFKLALADIENGDFQEAKTLEFEFSNTNLYFSKFMFVNSYIDGKSYLILKCYKFIKIYDIEDFSIKYEYEFKDDSDRLAFDKADRARVHYTTKNDKDTATILIYNSSGTKFDCYIINSDETKRVSFDLETTYIECDISQITNNIYFIKSNIPKSKAKYFKVINGKTFEQQIAKKSDLMGFKSRYDYCNNMRFTDTQSSYDGYFYNYNFIHNGIFTTKPKIPDGFNIIDNSTKDSDLIQSSNAIFYSSNYIKFKPMGIQVSNSKSFAIKTKKSIIIINGNKVYGVKTN